MFNLKIQALIKTLSRTLLLAWATDAFADDSKVTLDWPMHRGGQNLQGIAEGKLSSKLKVGWAFQAKRPKRDDGTPGLQPAIKASAIIHQDRVFVGDDNGTFYSISLKTGKTAWTFKAEDAIEGSALALGKKIIFGSGDGFVYCLQADSGKLLWKYETDDQVLAAPNWARNPKGKEDWVLAGSYDGSVHCINADDGKKVWKYATDNFVNGSPAIAGDKVIFGGCDTFLYVLDLATGKALESIEADAYIASSVAVRDEIGYLGHYDNAVIAFSTRSGDILWKYRKKSFPYFSSCAVTKKQVLIGGRDKALHAIDRKTGKGLWTFKTRGQVDSSPVVCDGKVLFGSVDGNFYSLDLETGEEVWSYDVGAAILASPAISNGTVVIGDEKGNLFAFTAQ